MIETTRGNELRLVDDGQAIEVIDELVDSWIVRYEPTERAEGVGAAELALATALTASLTQQLPDLARMIAEHGTLRVSFSPHVRRLIASGQYHLMDTARGLAPVAVDQTGHITELGRIAPGTAVTGTGLMAGGLLVGAWPIVLAVALAATAAWAEQRWLDRTFNELAASLGRIETRLRDDDFGMLEAADSLVANCRTSAGLYVPEQLRRELAVIRPRVDAIYLSRRRYVERLKHEIEHEQLEDEAKGKRGPWAPDVADRLTKEGVVEELVVFLQAMAVNARLNAMTAFVLADDGEPGAALRLLDSLEVTIRHDYHDLHNRLAALAKHTPELSMIGKITDRRDTNRARGLVSALTSSMEQTIGSQLPDRDSVLTLTLVPAAA